MSKQLEELREKAIKWLETQEVSIDKKILSNNLKDLIQELSIYHVELEHQNQALENSEKQLAEVNAEYIELFENAPVGYVIIDDNRVIRKANKVFIHSFVPLASHSDPVEGRCFDEFVCAEFKSTFELFCVMLRKPGIPVPVELKLIDRFAKPHYVLITAGERKADSKHFRLTISDIAMQKRLESQLVKARDEADERDRQKSVFLTTVSHELRTPLATIVGSSDLLNDPNMSESLKRDYLTSIQLSSKMILTFTDEVLDISSMESGIMPLHSENTEMSVMCSEVSLLLRRKCLDKNILVRVETNDIPLLWIDANRLRRAIFDIMDQAVENMSDGTLVLHVAFARDPERVNTGVLSVTISGKNIFSGETNYRSSIPRNPVPQQYNGLGMYLSKRIISAMGGRYIWEHPLNSLRIDIPVAISDHIEQPKVKSATISSTDPPRRCLLVDDVVLNLKVLGAMMKKICFIPELATSGQEALAMLAKKHYDIIVTDLWMPEMSGEEFAAAVRRDPKWDDVPIVAVTADIERDRNFDMTYFSDTIIKPISLEKLRTVFLDNLEKYGERTIG